LCLKLIASEETAEFEALAQELREALHAHVEQLRDHAERITLVNQLLLALEPNSNRNE
jgi:hypothetical protein